MRIISKTGMDFPYEQIVVMIDDNKVLCKPISNMSGREYLLGEYLSHERAVEIFCAIDRYYENCYIGDGYLFKAFVMPEV